MLNLLTDGVDVDGATIRYGVVEGRGEGPDLVLIHGNGAHHLWWAPVMEHLHLGRRLVLIDLSGHGDSGHRPDYRPVLWEREVLAVMTATASDRPVVVGHSMGGRVALSVAAHHHDAVSGLVMIDASVRPAHRYRSFESTTRRHNKVYATKDEIRSRFRLLPVQPEPPAAVLDQMAEYAVVETTGGWTWKYDPEALTRFQDHEVDAMARELACPAGFVYGSESVVVDDEIAAYFTSASPGPVSVHRIEGAHHHAILDAPRESAAIIEDCARSFALASGQF